MESIRLNEKNNIQNEIKRTESMIKRNSETINRLSSSQENKEFNQNQIEKIKNSQIDFDNKIKELNKRYNDLLEGRLDNELLSIINNNSKNIKQKEESINTKKIKDKTEKKTKEKDYFNMESKHRRREISSYQIQKDIDRFIRDCESIPEYILNNLKEMPSNKGYIWKGIHCYGNKPPESDTTIMFEKCKGGTLKIYETNKDYRTVYEKNGSSQKKMTLKERRNSIFSRDELEMLKIKYS